MVNKKRFGDYTFQRAHTAAPRRRKNLVDQHYNSVYKQPAYTSTQGWPTLSRRKKRTHVKQNEENKVHPLPR